MNIKKVTLHKQLYKLPEKWENFQYPEFAFLGRSNVGKSSLINMLTNRKHLAYTSETPGKTRGIYYYFVNDSWFLVDLPGYGYAQIAKEERKNLMNLIYGYLKSSPMLVNLFLLIDSRLEPQERDLEMIRWLGRHQIPFSLVFTKIDKLTPNQLNKNLTHYKNTLLKEWEALPPLFLTSSVKKIGREDLREYIETILEKIRKKER